MIEEICNHTNTYAWANIAEKQAYADKDGACTPVTPNEMERLLALIIYFGLVKLNEVQDYWSTKSLYHGLWARNIISQRNRFKALMAMLHIVDFDTEDPQDRLRKVRSFVEHIQQRCKELYQPRQEVAVDERMVKSKHRSGMRQYMPMKPVFFFLYAFFSQVRNIPERIILISTTGLR